ncbi:PP2C family protein-serine/threonine phosphatase [Cetobacterium somerae]
MEIYYSTHIGNRNKNEDSLLINKTLINNTNVDLKKYSSINKTINKFIICDGVGGNSDGEMASKFVLETFSKSFRNFNFNLIKTLIKEAQEKLNYYALINNIESIGTTIAGVILGKENNIFFNVGDTRIYKVSKNKITQLSKDHSLAQLLYEKGELSKRSIPFHRSRHILTSSICGGESSFLPDIFFNTFELKKNEILFICSDGVWEQLDDNELLKILTSKLGLKKSLEFFTNSIRMSANDNISFIVIKK